MFRIGPGRGPAAHDHGVVAVPEPPIKLVVAYSAIALSVRISCRHSPANPGRDTPGSADRLHPGGHVRTTWSPAFTHAPSNEGSLTKVTSRNHTDPLKVASLNEAAGRRYLSGPSELMPYRLPVK